MAHFLSFTQTSVELCVINHVSEEAHDKIGSPHQDRDEISYLALRVNGAAKINPSPSPSPSFSSSSSLSSNNLHHVSSPQ
jgi:hypothetical protein